MFSLSYNLFGVLLLETLSSCSQASPSQGLFEVGWGGEKVNQAMTGAEEFLSQSWILPEFFCFSGKEENEKKKDEKMAGEEKKKSPGLSQREYSSPTPAWDKLMCPFPLQTAFKIQPSTFKNLSLISNSNKLPAWWLLFCFLLPNSSLRLHNKSV